MDRQEIKRTLLLGSIVMLFMCGTLLTTTEKWYLQVLGAIMIWAALYITSKPVKYYYK